LTAGALRASKIAPGDFVDHSGTSPAGHGLYADDAGFNSVKRAELLVIISDEFDDPRVDPSLPADLNLETVDAILIYGNFTRTWERKRIMAGYLAEGTQLHFRIPAKHPVESLIQ